MHSITRAQFLRGDWQGKKPDLRPPWSLDEPAFSAKCDGCGECVTACETSIIFMSSRKLPLLDFLRGGCTFCGKCVEACDRGALQQGQGSGRQAWQLRATINDSCLAQQGTSCVSCIEECSYEAILAHPGLGGKTQMAADHERCVGCGMCYAKCPVNAISISPEKTCAAIPIQQVHSNG